MVEVIGGGQTKKPVCDVEVLRTSSMTDFENDPDAEGLHLEINEKRTKEL